MIPSDHAINSRQCVETALNHQQPDHVPLDLGASPVTGMHASSVYNLRQVLNLDPPGTPVKVTEAYQMLGEIAPDLQDALGVDVVGLGGAKSFFGFEYKDWKPWTTFDGTPVLVPGGFNTQPEPNGDRITFWGGGVDTQKTLPFGTPEDVCRQMRERIEILGRGGGYVFNTVHNVQAGTPAKNLLVLYEAVRV